MAGAGYNLFLTGSVLTAAQVNNYLQEQAVMRFASSAARTSALSAVLAEGMMSYLADTNAVEVYNGSAWVAVGSSSPLTTKGDLYGFSTLDARIPIGTNNQVLTADSTAALGLKWATAGSTFAGCSLTKSGSQSLATSTATAITFNTESIDTDAFHDNSTNTSRITIPAGKAGKYLLSANIAYAPNATGFRTCRFYKNGSLVQGMYTSSLAGTAQNTVLYYTLIISLAVSDYVELYGTQTSGGNLNVVGDDDSTGMTAFQAFLIGA